MRQSYIVYSVFVGKGAKDHVLQFLAKDEMP